MAKTFTGNTLVWAHRFDIDGFDTVAEAADRVQDMLELYGYEYQYDPATDNWTVEWKDVRRVF